MADTECTVELQCKEDSLSSTTSHFSSTITNIATLESEGECEKLGEEGKENCTEKNLVIDGMNSNDSTPSPVDEEFDNRLAYPGSPVVTFTLTEETTQTISNNPLWELQIGSATSFHEKSKPSNDERDWKHSTSEEELKQMDSERSKPLTGSFEESKISDSPIAEFSDSDVKSENEWKSESAEDTLRISCPKRPSIEIERASTPDSSNKKWLRYSRDQLLLLMCAPASKIWPDYFDIAFKKSEGKIDLEKWMRAKQESKNANGTAAAGKPTTVTNGTASGTGITERAPEQDSKRSKDPRERIKQEDQVRVVLSPQRKSFSTGCHVSQQGPLNLGGTSDANIDRTRELPVSRRIGSGRIARRGDREQLNRVDNRRDRDTEKDNLDQRRDHNKGWRSKNEGGGRFDRDDRHLDKRRRFFDDDDKRGDRRDSYRDNRDRRYDHRRPSVHKDYEEETPEWYTGGPSSQNEYIELVGFDEPEKEESMVNGKPKRERRRSRKEKDGESGLSSRCTTPTILEKEEPVELKVEELISEYKPLGTSKPENPIVVEPPDIDQDKDAIQFNVEDYLGSILNIGPEEIFQGGNSGASRLKQFFNSRESPIDDQNRDSQSRNSPSKDNFSQLGNLLGFAEPVIISSPNPRLDSSHFFAPISPADKTNGESLVDMLHKANSKKIPQQPVAAGSGRLPPPSIKDLLMGGKGQSVEELEANLRKGGQQSMCGIPPHMNQQQHHGYNIGKQQSVQQTHMRQNHMNNQQNPFNDFLSQLNEDQRRVIADKKIDSENFLAKLLKDSTCAAPGPIGNKPSLPNNAATESELIARLMKVGNTNMNPSLSSMNIQSSRPPPSINNMNLPPHNLNPNHAPSLPQHSPSRSHMMPQTQQQHSSTNNSEIFMKLLQNQQMQQQQKKQHMLHPGYQPHSQQQQHDPIKQLLGGINNMGINSQNQDHHSREVHSLFQRVASGQLSDTQLISQLNSGNLNPSQRETVATVLKLMTCHHDPTSLMPPRANLTPSPTSQAMISGGLSLGNAPSSISPRVASPNPDASGMLAPHMMQQNRVSPLMFGGSGAPRRTPSHQELVVHAQSILQKALLKNELERAKEKHRKREAERTRSPNPAVSSIQNGPSPSLHNASLNRANQDGSPTKGPKCQSPLAFTPISVLRKMTAEKDRMDKDKQEGYNMIEVEKSRDSHSRMTNHLQNSTMHHGMNMKDRKIHKVPSPLPSGNSMLGPRAQMVMSGAPTPPMMNLGANHPGLVPPHQRHMSMQPSMPMGRTNLHHNANNIRVMQHAQQQQQQQQQHQQAQQMMRNLVPHLNNMGQHSMHNRMPNTHNAMQHLMHNNNNYKPGDSSLDVPPRQLGSQSSSPINSFMNFFGRDMIAKVQAGAMPELPGGKALSLEEVERQHTQAVPN